MKGPGGERGAALVEYVMLVALVALVASAAIDHIGTALDDHYETTADGVGGGSWSSPGGTPGGGGGDVGPAPTTNPPVPTSTTTTTTPPTTTTPATTTTTTAPPSATARAVVFASSSWSAGWFRWAGSATYVIVDGAGRPIVGASVQVRVTTSGGTTTTVTVSTDANGRAVVEVGPYEWYGSWGGTSHVDVAILGVVAPGSTWDGSAPTTRLDVP
jgi:Flp pilus assembly pilin Flp